MHGPEQRPERYTDEARELFARARRRAESGSHAEVTPLHLFAELVAGYPEAFRSAAVDPDPLLLDIEARLGEARRGDGPARLDGSMDELILRVEKLAKAVEDRVGIAQIAQALFEKRAIQSLPGAADAASAFAALNPQSAPLLAPPAQLPAVPAEPVVDALAIAKREFPPSNPLVQRVITELRNPTARPSWVGLVVLVVSLGAFVVTLGETNVTSIGTLVGVLLFHECGHWIGMRLFGYRDVKMFFIPFFGAAVSGNPEGVAGWKRGLVLLLGPLPGIVVACALAIAYRVGPAPWLRVAALALAGVNGMNLLPFEPFDGGQLVRLVLSSRFRFLDILSLVAAALGMAWLGHVLSSTALYVLAALALAGLTARIRMLDAAKAVRGKYPALPTRIADASEEELTFIIERILVFTPHREPVNDARVRTIAGISRNIYDQSATTAPSLGVSLALGGAQLAGFALALIALVLVVGHAKAGGAPGRLDQVASLPDGSLTIHYPAGFANTKGDSPTTIVLQRVASGHLEAVMVTMSSGVSLDPRVYANALSEKKPALKVGTGDTCLGRPGVEVSGAFTGSNGTELTEFGCASVRGSRLVHARYLAAPQVAKLDDAELRAILGTVEVAP